jgi:hypothetical protein
MWAGLATACLGIVLWSSCGQKPAANDTPPAADATQGYVQYIEAKGYVIKGADAKDWMPYQRTRFDADGKELRREELSEFSEPVYTTSYDAQGRVVKVQRKGQDQMGDIDYTTTWSADGLESTEEEYIHREEKLIFRTITQYDTAGNVLQRTILGLQFKEYGVDTQRTINSYDTAGRLLKSQEYFQGKTIPSVDYTYNAAGHLVRIVRYDAEGKISRTENIEVDAQGRKVAVRVQEQGQAVTQLTERYVWDASGKVAEEIRYSGDCSPAGEQSGKCIIQETTRYTYDAQGRPLTQELSRLGASGPVMQLRYSYEPFKQ